MRHVVKAFLLAIVGCAGADHGPMGFPECLMVTIDSAANVGRVVDDLHILPGREFVVRLDGAEVSTWNVQGRRLGLPSSTSGIEFVADGVWQERSPDSVFLHWWEGYDGVSVKLTPSAEHYRGIGIQEDDAGCPGSDYCYEGTVSAAPMACPVIEWVQADSSGWVRWRQ